VAKRFLYRILCGMFLGISVIAPGFSGSVVAIAMGIYQDLLRIASNPFKPLKQNVLYCLPLALGGAISAVLFTFAFNYLLKTYEKATYMLFVGLIAGNLPIIFSETKKHGLKKRYLIGVACAFAASIAFGLSTFGDESIRGAQTLSANWYILALSGFAAGVTAIMPGTSVTVVLIMFGVYSQLIYIAELLIKLDFTYLAPFGLFCLCVLIGIVATSKVVKIIFEKYPGFSNSTVFGFVAGSLIIVLAQCLKISDENFNWAMGLAMLAAGFAVSILFVVLRKTMNKAEIQNE